jgi:ATP-binding cassette subfamily B protein
MSHGRIVERGTHQELLAAEGAYAHMWRLQQQEEQQVQLQPPENLDDEAQALASP